MALIPVYHTVANYYAVDPAHDAVNSPIIEGMVVKINASGYVVASAATASDYSIGIAGDNLSTTGYNSNGGSNHSNTPYGASIVISGNGATAYTQNRVSDFYNETKGSGKMTVYTGVGDFYTDQYSHSVAVQTWVPGVAVYSDSAGKLTTFSNGGAARRVGYCITAPTEYPSGVPGTTISGSMSLGAFVRFALNLG